jgi:hypothetical protein
MLTLEREKPHPRLLRFAGNFDKVFLHLVALLFELVSKIYKQLTEIERKLPLKLELRRVSNRQQVSNNAGSLIERIGTAHIGRIHVKKANNHRFILHAYQANQRLGRHLF